MRLETYFVFSSPVARVSELKGHQAGAYLQSHSGKRDFDGVWVFLRDRKENSLSPTSMSAFADLCYVYSLRNLSS